MYRDKRLAGYDAATVVEVIEHLDPPRLAAFERVLFEAARPNTVVVTTPNVEYNVKFETLPAGQFRHKDHRFEWTRDSSSDGQDNRGAFRLFGPVSAGRTRDPQVGAPTQMGIFTREHHDPRTLVSCAHRSFWLRKVELCSDSLPANRSALFGFLPRTCFRRREFPGGHERCVRCLAFHSSQKACRWPTDSCRRDERQPEAASRSSPSLASSMCYRSPSF